MNVVVASPQPEDARELQSELRKLDRALKEIDANVKKYEKLLLTQTTIARPDESTTVDCEFWRRSRVLVVDD